MSEKLLEIHDLEVIYKTGLETVYAVNKINLNLEKGKTLGLVGETGAGKTTTALAILALLPERTAHVKGEIIFDGQDLLQLKEYELREIRGEKISMIFQYVFSAPGHLSGSKSSAALPSGAFFPPGA